jgi:hypothetical protein
MPEENAGAGNQGGGQGGAGGGAGSAGGAGTFDWAGYRGTLGDLGKEKSLDPIFSSEDVPGNLIKGYIEGQKLIGGSIRIPAKDMKPEDRTKAVSELITKLRTEGVLEGPPESPEQYEMQFPQGVEINKPFFDSLAKKAHALGMPNSMLKELSGWYLQEQYNEQLKNQNSMITEKETLKKEWGPLYGKKHELSRRAAVKYMGEDAEEVFADLPPKVGARIVKAFSAIGEALAEHDLISGEVPGGQSLQDVQQKIQKIQADKNGPAFDPSLPGHQAAKKELQDLIALYTQLGGKWGSK